MFLRYLSSLCRKVGRHEGPRRQPFRPRLVQLEDRLQPTSLLWVAPANVDLSQQVITKAGNWITQAGTYQAPTSADSLVFDPNQTYAGVKGSNVSPVGILGGVPGGTPYTGLYMGYGYTGTVNAGGSLNIDGNVTIIGGTLTAPKGSTLTLASEGQADFFTFGAANFEGQPELDMDVDLTTFVPEDPNLPPVPVTMNVNGPGTINGTVYNAGVLNFQSGNNFTVTGPSIFNSPNGVVNLTGSETFGGGGYYFTNQGLVDDYNFGTSTTASTFTNQGTLEVGATLHLMSALPTQSQGPGPGAPETRLVAYGHLWVDSPYTVLGGWVDGNGTIQGNLDNGDPTGMQKGSGTVHPGLINSQRNADGTWGSGGEITVTGDFDQTYSATLWIDVTQTMGGSSMGQLQVQGTAYLGGLLQVVRGSQCLPTPDNGNFQFITWGSLNGYFDADSIWNNSWVGPDGQSHWFVLDLTTNPGGLELTVS